MGREDGRRAGDEGGQRYILHVHERKREKNQLEQSRKAMTKQIGMVTKRGVTVVTTLGRLCAISGSDDTIFT